jgi:hypothetical protein
MFLTLAFLAESIGSAAKFFRRRFDHGELAMAAVLKAYFGKPVYICSLKVGIKDGLRIFEP